MILADFDTTYDLNLIIHYHNYPSYLESCLYLGKYWANYVAYFYKQQIGLADVKQCFKSYLHLTILIIQTIPTFALLLVKSINGLID